MTEAASGEPQRLISASDLGNLAGLPLLALISWLLPARAALGFCRYAGPAALPMLTSDRARTVACIHALAGDSELAIAPDNLPEALASEDLYALFWILRSHARKPFPSRIELAGREHLDAALARGNGVIIWRPHLVHGCLPLFKAFHDAGHPLTHFSHVRHGFSDSRFGIRFLNPLRIRAEDGYLAGRVERTDTAPTAALRALMRQLDDNRVVSMATRGDSGRWIEAPLLAGRDRIAPGAPHLAYTRGAPLLPVFPIRNADESYTVTVGEPLTVDTALPREMAIEAAACELARRLEPHVRSHPEQWLGWLHL